MKHFCRFGFFLLFLAFVFAGVSLYGQETAIHAKNMLNAGPHNYTFFSESKSDTSGEVIRDNPGFEQHPEIGRLFAETPCDNCYELIGKRTLNSKTFIKKGTNGKDIMLQTSSMPMHFKDEKGNWRTIVAGLQPDKTVKEGKGVYSASHQESPVIVNLNEKFTSLGNPGSGILFNNQLELIYKSPTGEEKSLGTAEANSYTAGDEGVYIKNAWPGVDIEQFVVRGAVKTNFIINYAMPAYAAGRLLVRDHLHMDNGLTFYAPAAEIYTGNLEINNASGEKVFVISAATAFEKNAMGNTLKLLEYAFSGQGQDRTLDIVLPGEFLNRPAASYPVVIDPLVTATTSTSVTGSTYISCSSFSTGSCASTGGCTYFNAATVPAMVTVTDVQFSFQYVTNGAAKLLNGGYDFKLGACRSPSSTGLFWNCNSTLTGTCTATAASILSSLAACMPGPQCSSYDLGITMDFYQNFGADAACGSAYIYAGTPLIVTTFGHTVESNGVVATSTSVCQGQSATLSSTSTYGVGPYTYVWLPGGATTTTLLVTPASTTTYTIVSTDQCGNVATATETITVNPIMPVIGSPVVCQGNTTTYTNGVAGGAWSSSNAAVAQVGIGTGIVTGVATGSAAITYTTAAGCTSFAVITVLPLPANITGARPLCQSATETLVDATGGGTWTSSTTVVATIVSGSGLLSGVNSGTTVITYTSTNGCLATATVTVNPISPVAGTPTVCVGGTTLLSDVAGGGIWSGSGTTIATVNSTSGLVTGVSLGTTLITYTTAAGCKATTTVSVTLLSGITGITGVCQGNTTSLSDPATGGTWQSINTAVATIGLTTGVVMGVSAGTSLITYLVPGGCYSVTTVTVNPVGPITGTTTLCTGNTTTLSDITAGGTWGSLSTGVASVITTSGIVTGVGTGTAILQYTTAAGCIATTTVTVLALPSAITGGNTICQGSTSTLSDVATGGAWASSNTSVATIGLISGTLTGVAAGPAVITYTIAGGCFVTLTETVNPLGNITGPAALCVGSSATLTDATTGGTWFSTTPGVASIVTGTGLLTAVATGTTLISYTTPAGCIATITETIDALFPISGTPNVCQGSTTTLSNSVSGGTWSSSNIFIASAGFTTGVVAGVASGTAIITYTTPGGCYTTITVTVNPLAPITGTIAICQGGNSILSDATPGGTWNSTNTAVATIGITSGIVAGLAPGTATIVYTTAGGCIGTKVFTVNPLAAITGTLTVCQGSSTLLSNAVSGGNWISQSPLIASIGSGSGLVSGLNAGTALITYTTPAGCISSATVIVNPLAGIIGPLAICQGNTGAFADATGGGTWASSNTLVATIGGTSGITSGLAAGTTVITYTTPAGCITSVTLMVNPISPITGFTSFCSTTTLSDATAGGTWISSDPSIASIGISSGIVSSYGPGTVTITYTSPAGCSATTTVTVNAFVPISGTPTVCVGNTTTLTNAVAGGAWSSSASGIAMVGSASGIVTGITSGAAIISYTTAAGCLSTIGVTVYALAPITGLTTLCQSSTTLLSNGIPGGHWSSSIMPVATVGLSTGIVAGISGGTSLISYTTLSGCLSTVVVTVNPLFPVSGPVTVCQGSTVTLNDLPNTGGTWYSSRPGIATVNITTGIVTGISAGTATISYTTTEGCVGTLVMTVTPLFAIAGSSSVCQGSTISLTDAATGGTWLSDNPGVAPIGVSTGLVNGLSPGTANITYTTPAGCTTSLIVTVNPLQPITGILAICAGTTTLLSDATPGGGAWTSGSAFIATINSITGLATGISAGTSSITFSTVAGCITTATLTVYPFPSSITGITSLCAGTNTTLFNSLSGGIWQSGNTTVATVGISSGIVFGVAAGTSVISYTTSSECNVTTTVTVNPLPPSITGNQNVCQGGSTILTDAFPGGTWSCSSTAICTIGSVSGVLSGISPGVVTITYSTPAGCITTMLVNIDPLPAAITGMASVCAGSSTTLFNTLSGGTWTSSNTSVATIVATTGVLTGISAGTSVITYITPSNCFATIVATVNPTPVIGGYTFSNPTTCIATDGIIILTGLTPGETYTVQYLLGGSGVLTSIVANGLGQVIINLLAAGSYSSFTVTTSLGCVSNIVSGPVVLTLPSPPPAPVAGNNSPVCAGSPVDFTATDATSGVTWSWTGPGGFTSNLQNPVISSATVAQSGTYSVTATKLACVSAPATTVVVVHPIPDITNITFTNPTTCLGNEGTITLAGLLAGVSYQLTYQHNGNPISLTLVANSSGDIIITGLTSGVYANFQVSSFTCLSNIAGPVTLSDPIAPPIPALGSNSPICSGKTLMLTCEDAGYELVYDWEGPNGFSSDLQNPQIPNVTLSDSGTYRLVIRSRNCPVSDSLYVTVHPPVVLVNVTPDTLIPFGSSLQLNADGAEFYLWLPNDGSIINVNTYNPVATPQQPTIYSVIGINQWGCADTVNVNVNVDYNVDEFIPNTFTPNGDGYNDIFRLGNIKYDKLVDFSIFNRWGQLVYHNSYDATKGWDGTFNGVPQPIGTYNYYITLDTPEGKLKYFKGTVTLLR